MSMDKQIGVPGFSSSVTNKSTFPAPSTKTGTIDHDNTSKWIVGTGTAFLTECMVGDYLYANDELRKITDIDSNTRMQVESAFGANLNDVDVKIVKAGIYRHVGFKNIGGVDGELDGNAFPSDEAVNYNWDAGLAPIAYDATGTEYLITTIK